MYTFHLALFKNRISMYKRLKLLVVVLRVFFISTIEVCLFVNVIGKVETGFLLVVRISFNIFVITINLKSRRRQEKEGFYSCVAPKLLSSALDLFITPYFEYLLILCCYEIIVIFLTNLFFYE